MDIEPVQDMLKCLICLNKFTLPITLPCGETICRNHLDIILSGDYRFKCEMCDSEHIAPVEGFGENRIIQRMLQLNLEKLDPSC